MAEGDTVEYTYNALGQVETVSDSLGNCTTYTHDAIGQVTGITDAMGNTTAFTYTADGRIATVTDALGNIWISDVILALASGNIGEKEILQWIIEHQ